MPNTIVDTYISNLLIPNGRILQSATEDFFYTGGTPTYMTRNIVKNMISLDINGLEESRSNYEVYGKNTVKLLYNPVLGSKISINYSY
jgi:hypothetical protein